MFNEKQSQENQSSESGNKEILCSLFPSKLCGQTVVISSAVCGTHPDGSELSLLHHHDGHSCQPEAGSLCPNSPVSPHKGSGLCFLAAFIFIYPCLGSAEQNPLHYNVTGPSASLSCQPGFLQWVLFQLEVLPSQG